MIQMMSGMLISGFRIVLTKHTKTLTDIIEILF